MISQFVHDLLQNIDQLKIEANRGDIAARAKAELYGMMMLLYQANIKVYGPERGEYQCAKETRVRLGNNCQGNVERVGNSQSGRQITNSKTLSTKILCQ